MAAPGENSNLCVRISHSKSVVTVQRAFSAKYAKEPPREKTIRAWYKQFTETGCLCKQKSRGRPLTADDDAEGVWASFLHTSNISSCQKNFSFPTAVNNSIEVGLLVYLLQIFLIPKNIMKRPIHLKPLPSVKTFKLVYNKHGLCYASFITWCSASLITTYIISASDITTLTFICSDNMIMIKC
jgi:hypothetical protein